MKRRNFSASFREEAVKLVREGGRSAGKAAKELGLSESALRRWIEASDVEQGSKAGLTMAEKSEIRELKRENATLRMERDILKKAVSFFAKENQ
ncbi:MAG: transposase [Proteobacteria bacterium]|nr:transposase [Pseudomonadota bacterium]